MTTIEAIILGLVQGFTEFLPISSSGHLLLAEWILKVDVNGKSGLLFEVIVHAGTLLSIMVVFRKDVLTLLVGTRDLIGRVFGRKASDPMPAHLVLMVVVGTMPLVVVVPWIKDAIEEFIRHNNKMPYVLAACFAVTAGLLWATRGRDQGNTAIDWRLALAIGCVQLVAILPGISRSGSTIAAALLISVGRKDAARFSFMLAIPAILGACILKAKDVLESGEGLAHPTQHGIAFLVAFASGLLSLLILVKVVDRGRLWTFAPYCLLVAIGTLIFAMQPIP